MRTLLRTILLLLFALAALPRARAQSTQPQSPAAEAPPAPGLASGSRILKTFDFEERPLGNFESLPMFWNKVADRGFPLYTSGKFVNDVSRSATTSFRMDLDGGSIAYRYTPGKLSVNPNADYYVVGFVKTTALPHARAQLTAWFADADGKLLESTEVHSEPWASLTGQDDWHLIQFFMPGTAAAARSLVLQMGVYQPQQFAGALGPYELYRQDIHGAVWWDDLSVFQLPRLNLATNVPGNVFGPNQKVALSITVSDLGRDQLTATLSVRDAASQLAFSQHWPMERTPGLAWSKAVTLPPLPPGFYTAALDVADPKTIVVRHLARFVTLAGLESRGTPAREFGVNATAWPVDAWHDLAPVATQLQVGLVKLPAWRTAMTEDSLLRKDPAFDDLTMSLGRADISAIAAFGNIPNVLASKLANSSSSSVLSLLDSDTNIWKPYISFILARYAMRISLWQIGQDSDPFYAADPRYAALYRKVFGEVSSLLTTPRLVIPWNALYEFPAQDFPNAVLDLRLPAVIKPAQIPAYIRSFQTGSIEVLASIEPLDNSVPRLERLNDFVERVAFTHAAAPHAVLIDLPLTRQSSFGPNASEPLETLIVYRTLVQQLADTDFRGDIPIYPGVHALLFDHAGDGTLILWNQNPQSSALNLRLALGAAPQSVALSGAQAPVPVTDGFSTVTVTASPLIFDHVDTALLQLRHSFRLAASNLPAGLGSLQTTVQLTNPYTQSITGTLRLEPPPGWSVDPPSFRFSLQPGHDLRQPVTVRYPFSEYAGAKALRATLTLDQPFLSRPLDLITYVTVSSDVVDMDCFPTFLPNGSLVIQQMITNISNEPLNGQAYAMAPGMARQELFVLDLQPGQSTIKRFIFPDAASLAGKTAALGLHRTDGQTLLTKSVPIK